jgi:hypothetical protein
MEHITLTEILLGILVIEVGYIAYAMSGGSLPWMIKSENGLMTGIAPSEMKHKTVGQKLGYLACLSRFQAEAENQRYAREQGMTVRAEDLRFDG